MGVIVEQQELIKRKMKLKRFSKHFKNLGRHKRKALDSNAPSLVYEEGDIIKRTLRDTYDNDTKNVYVRKRSISKAKNS